MSLLIFIALLILMAIAAPLIGASSRRSGSGRARYGRARSLLRNADWSQRHHFFGVDQIGRDVFSRTVYGARVSLIVAFSATIIATIAGIFFGLLSGYFRGWTDTIISRSVDVLLAIPYLLLATGLATACTVGVTEGTEPVRLSGRRGPAGGGGGDLRHLGDELDLHGEDRARARSCRFARRNSSRRRAPPAHRNCASSSARSSPT